MAVLLQYNLATDFDPSTVADGVTGSTLTNQSLSAFTQGTAGYASDAVFAANPTSGATSASLAISNNSYFFFSITPVAGKQISLTSLTINLARGGAATPRGYDIRSSADDFATTLGTADLSTQRPNWTAVSIDLSGAAFQSLTSTVTFKVFIYAPATTNSVDGDDLIINGTVTDAGTFTQEGFRFRNDDGSETTATWIEDQDVEITAEANTNIRLRVLVDTSGDTPDTTYQLESSPNEDETWGIVQ